jgi:hypothetical protein
VVNPATARGLKERKKVPREGFLTHTSDSDLLDRKHFKGDCLNLSCQVAPNFCVGFCLTIEGPPI